MFNFVYWPISVILWFWHKVFSLVLNPDSGLSWVLAIMFLTFTLRLVLVKPTLNQMRSMTKMQEMQPHMAAIKERYKSDHQKIAEETRKLQKEHGVNPIAGCLPAFVQMPVFLGLFHVLRSFNRTGNGPGQLGLSVAENRELPNYFFSAHDVQSFLDARLFGVPLSAYISMKKEMYDAFQPVNFDRTTIMMVAVPLIAIIALATHFNGKMSVNRSKRRQQSGLSKAPTSGQMAMQAEMMNKMMVWVFPFMIVFTGALWHIGLLFYMVSNNIWTFFQQRWLFTKLDKEEAEALAAKKAKQQASGPRPGQKPINPKKGGRRAGGDTPGDAAATATATDGTAAATATAADTPKGFFGPMRAAWKQMMAEAEQQHAAKQSGNPDTTPAARGATTTGDDAGAAGGDPTPTAGTPDTKQQPGHSDADNQPGNQPGSRNAAAQRRKKKKKRRNR